jgi:hypothetical protein
MLDQHGTRSIGDDTGDASLVRETTTMLPSASTDGLLTPEESQEYAEIVRLNDMLSLLKLKAEAFWTIRAAS